MVQSGRRLHKKRAKSAHKKDFPSLFAAALRNGYKKDYGIAGFRKAGIIPFNPDVISSKQLGPSIPFSETNDTILNTTPTVDLTMAPPPATSISTLTSCPSPTAASTPLHTSASTPIPTTSTSTPTSSVSSSISSTSSLRDFLAQMLKPTTPRRPVGKRKQLIGVGESLTSEEAISKIKVMEEEKEKKLMEKEEKKKEREEKKRERN